MSNHDHNTHNDHNTEGDRQSYKKGWWISIVGLLIIALGFSSIGSFAFSISGTERWGKTEQCEEKCEKEGACCEGKKEGKAACHADAMMKGETHDSIPAKSEHHHDAEKEAVETVK